MSSDLIKIGKGAYGSVFETPEKTIIKKMKFIEGDEIVEPNLREICFLATIKNTPYFSEFIKVEKKDNDILLHQKYKGTSLKSLSRSQTFDERKRFFPTLIRELAKILCILKNLNVVHRDIKDANICVDDNKISLIDFGLIKTVNKNQVFDGYNGTEYNRDLKVDDEDKIDWKYDMFSSGSTLFTYLKGSYPEIVDIYEFKKDVDSSVFEAWLSMFKADRITPEELLEIVDNDNEKVESVEYKTYIIHSEIKDQLGKIKKSMLYVLVDWMIDVLSKAGTYLVKYGIHLFLRYLNKVSNKPKPNDLQLVVSSVIYLTGILNNNCYLSPQTISILTADTFTASQIMEYAGVIASELEYEIYPFGFEDEASLSKNKTKNIYLDSNQRDLHSSCFHLIY